jgi:hypothetical protein
VLGAIAAAGLLLALLVGLVAASAIPPAVPTFAIAPMQVHDYTEDCEKGYQPAYGVAKAPGWPRPTIGCLPDGLSLAEWSLDPSFAYSATSTEIHVQVDEIACFNFYGARGAIAQNVRYRPDGITITLAVQLAKNHGPCPGPNRSPYVVRLSEPVGGRPLTDGAREDPQPGAVQAK